MAGALVAMHAPPSHEAFGRLAAPAPADRVTPKICDLLAAWAARWRWRLVGRLILDGSSQPCTGKPAANPSEKRTCVDLVSVKFRRTCIRSHLASDLLPFLKLVVALTFEA